MNIIDQTMRKWRSDHIPGKFENFLIFIFEDFKYKIISNINALSKGMGMYGIQTVIYLKYNK